LTTASRRSTPPPTRACAPPSSPVSENAAVVIVAQRVSTIMHAERIIVLDDGRVVGMGTHAELLESCDPYHEIVVSQLGEDAAL
jgi:ATP-binding cassette subfamily B multidrug efflux pump